MTASAQAQEPAPCATPGGHSEWLRRYQQNPAAYPKSDDMLYVPVQIHIVGNDEGEGYYGVNQLLNAFCQLNEDFLPANIQFYFNSPINYINDSGYYEHDFDGGADLIENNNFPNAINCYFVLRAAGACGYFFPGVDGVVLAKSCVGPGDHTWAHEVGHFLSLPHTFSGWEGYEHDYSQPAPEFVNGREVERADSSNCAQAGDGFCDTAADYLNYRWSCTANNESGVIQHDPDTLAFRSAAKWFMSYSLDPCMSEFSPEQIAAMRANLSDERANLPSLELAFEYIIPDTPILTAITPLQGSFVEGVSSLTLEWEPIPNATHYLVQWNPFPFFSVVLNQEVTEGNSITLTGLASNEDYSWRIRPFNAYQTCAGFTGRSTFNTGTLVNAPELNENYRVRLYPNPAGRGESFTLDMDWPASMAVRWTISDALGRQVVSGLENVAAGGHRQTIDARELTSGLYFLRLYGDGVEITRKLVVQ